MLKFSKIIKTEYYFVASDVILNQCYKCYRKSRNSTYKAREPDGFIRDPDNRFFYSRTTLAELQAELYPKVSIIGINNISVEISKYFSYRNNDGDLMRVKDIFIPFFHEYYERESVENNLIKYTLPEFRMFENEIFTVVEAGYTCHLEDVLPRFDYRTPTLLTGNTEFYNIFIRDENLRGIFGKTIGLLGYEHLVPVALYDDVLEQWNTNNEPL